jgi:8-oxo-dGTP diphosphatase
MKKSKRRKFTGRTATAIIPKTPNMILLVKRLTPPFSGYWALPGGKLDPGETVEETVIREVKEETGLVVTIVKKIGEYHEKGIQDVIEYDYMPACFLVKIVGGKIQEQKTEIESVKFFPLKSIPKILAFEHNQMVKDYTKHIRKNQK